MSAEAHRGRGWRGFLLMSLVAAAVALSFELVASIALRDTALSIVIGLTFVGVEVVLARVFLWRKPFSTPTFLKFFKWWMIGAIALALAQCSYFFIRGAFTK